MMRTPIILSYALAMLLGIGCSVEPLTDSTLEERNLTTEAPRNQPFVMQGEGVLFLTPSHSAFNTECEGYTLIETEGLSTEATLGHFNTSTRICTNHDDFYEVRGVHKFSTGEELYFRSVEYVQGKDHYQMLMIFDGGTGRFAGATGIVEILEETDFQSVTHGTYVNEGSGVLMIDRAN